MRALLAVAAALIAAAPATAERPPQIGWGKPGVTFEEYRFDAVSCGRKGYYRDVSHTEAAKVFRDATQQLDTISDTGPAPVDKWQTEQIEPSQGAASLSRYEEAPSHLAEMAQRVGRVVEGTQPEKRMREVGQLLQSTVEQCLSARGYHRFQLTTDQQNRLRKLRRGTPERQEYLYALASSAEVLGSQSID